MGGAPRRPASVYEEIGQAFVTLLPEVKTWGVMGDTRTYEMVCCLRAVQSSDFMTANVYPMPWDLLNKISSRIINEVRGINRVTYDPRVSHRRRSSGSRGGGAWNLELNNC